MPYTQENRICSMVTPLGDDVLLVKYLHGREALSNLFCFELDLISEKPDIAFDQIIGKPVAIRLEFDGGGERWFHGVVSRFCQGVSQGRFTSYTAEVVPWLWFLTRRYDCRIFQHKSVPEIIEDVFRRVGFTDFELQLGSYEPREYCVQYRETDFNFVSRLMEDVGISYYFKHEEKQHTMVLFDSPDGNVACAGQAEACYATGSEEDRATGEVEEWSCQRELRAGKYALTDYNFETPSLDLMAHTNSSISVGGNDRFEIYDYPGTHCELSQGDGLVRLRMEEEETASYAIRGQGTCAAFSPGYTFDLIGHYRESFNDRYLLGELEHELTQGVGDDGEAEATYHNSFACIPHSVPYRPPRVTPRPRITGVQTATVVGAGGKEIDVDKHGRIVVQFHWDREGKRDDQSSCRIRVAQNWAGKSWGLIAHPRIGQEVIVEFLEGDPDRPIVTGRVYNGEQMPPYGLPGSDTQTGIKSRSSPGGSASNFNEIRMEDKKGSEQLYVQAEKNMDTLVKNDQSENVGNDQTESVGHDRTRTVGNNETVTVGVDETRSVGSNRTRSVGASETVTVTAQRTHTVGINETISVGAAQEVTVGAFRALTVGANQTTSIGANHSVSVGSNQSVEVGSDQSVEVGSNRSLKVGKNLAEEVQDDYSHKSGKKILVDAGEEITIQTGKAIIQMKKNGDILIEGKKITIKGSGDIIMKGKKILEN